MPIKKYVFNGLVCVSILALVCVTFFMSEQASCGEPVSLNEIVNAVVESNPALHASKASKQAKNANLAQKKGAFLPSIDFRSSFNRTNSPPGVFTEKLSQEQFAQRDFDVLSLNDPSARSNWKNELIISQPVFNRGTEYVGYKSAEIEACMEQLATQVLAMQLAYKAEDAYLKALLALDAIEAANASLRATEAIEALAQKRFSTGLALKADVLAAQVQKNAAISLQDAARADYKNAIAAINWIVGAEKVNEMTQLASFDESAFKERSERSTPDVLSVFVEMALSKRPDLKFAKQYVEQADVAEIGAKLAFLPSLNLMAAWENNSKELSGSGSGNAWSVGAVMTFNLFNGDKDRQKLIEANANKQKMRLMLEDMANQVKLEVTEAFNVLLAAKSQVELACSSVQQAEEALRIMQSRYEGEMALMVETLAAEASLRQARLSLSEARYKWRVADARLRLATGKILTQGNEE